ncbi:cytochrome b/b6 domain-containing protein [Streptomyces sp. NPDC055722]
MLPPQPTQLRERGAHVETSSQTVGLVILAAVAAITAAHATIMVARRLMSRRAAPDLSLRRTVRVWDLGVRFSHWAIFTNIAVLSVTGYYLANPIPSRGHGSGNVTMASIRFVHLLFAVLFTASVLFRIYWFFGGNRWAGWRYWMPTTRSRLRGLRLQAAYYAFVRRTPPPENGHNALAGAAYAVIYLFFAVQVVSGFAMLFADGVTLRFLHGVVMWVILAFLIHHVYSAVLIDTEDHSAMVASIFTGNKRLTKEYLAAAEDTYVD